MRRQNAEAGGREGRDTEREDGAGAPRDLRERTKAFALRVIRMYAALPKTTLAQVLGKQALRAGTSVGANYREADRSRSKREFVAKLGDCLKEADETSYWLELLVEADVVPASRMAGLLDEIDQLTAILVTIINNTRQGM